MATPESLVKALASGLIEALLAQPAAGKKDKPTVIKSDDVRRAVDAALPSLLAQMAGEEPAQQDLFAQPGEIDVGDALYARKLAETAARAAGMEQAEPADTFDPNLPDGAPWTSAARS